MHTRPGDTSAEDAGRERDTETLRLLHAYHQDGDTGARDRLVQLYLPLVEKLARRYRRVGADHDDLTQAGSVGLLNAIERYDRSRGAEFAAFAVPTIVGELKRHIRDRTGTVRLPRPLQEAGARLPQARNELTVRLGRTPRDGELAAELDIDPDDLAYLEGARAVQSFPDPDLLLVRSASRASEAALSDERMQLAAAFRALAPAEQEVLYLRYVRDLGRTEAADRLGISEGQLSRRTQAALGKLRAQIESVGSPRATPPSAAHGRSEGDAVSAPQLERSGKARPRAGRSGRLVLRMPPSLHAELANAAERDSLSLNQFITNALSAAVEGREAEARERRPRLESRTVGRRWLRAAFIANVVAVVAVGVLAVILVVAGWDGAW